MERHICVCATDGGGGGVKPMWLIYNGMVAVVKSSIVKIEALQDNAHDKVWRNVPARVCSKKRKSSAAAEWLWTTNRQGAELHYPTINHFADQYQQRFSQCSDHCGYTRSWSTQYLDPATCKGVGCFGCIHAVAAGRSTCSEARGRICRLLVKREHCRETSRFG